MEFSSDWLRKYSKNHLKYEVEMLIFSIFAFKESTRMSIDKQGLRNIAIESFCIHLRNLIVFLYERPESDDVSACMYVTHGNWFSIIGEMPKVLRNAKQRVSKEAAHLTAKRCSDDEWQKKQWYFVHYIENILPKLVLFAENADKDYLDPEFVDFVLGLEKKFLN